MIFFFLLLLSRVTAWELVLGPIAPNLETGSDTRFGNALCLEGTTLGVGAVADDDYYYDGRAGAVYIANADVLQSKLFGNSQKPRDLGASCTFSDGLLVAGGPKANQILTWTTAVDPPEVLTGPTMFGMSMDGFQDYLLVGSTSEVRYFRRRQNAWQLRDTQSVGGNQVKFTPDGQWAFAASGTSLEVYRRRNQRLRPRQSVPITLQGSMDAGNTCLIVGDKNQGLPSEGQVEIVEYDGSNWAQTSTLNPPVKFGFGSAVAVSSLCDQAVACGQLICYEYDKVNGVWTLNGNFTLPNINSIVATPGFDRLYVGNVIRGGKYYVYE